MIIFVTLTIKRCDVTKICSPHRQPAQPAIKINLHILRNSLVFSGRAIVFHERSLPRETSLAEIAEVFSVDRLHQLTILNILVLSEIALVCDIAVFCVIIEIADDVVSATSSVVYDFSWGEFESAQRACNL